MAPKGVNRSFSPPPAQTLSRPQSVTTPQPSPRAAPSAPPPSQSRQPSDGFSAQGSRAATPAFTPSYISTLQTPPGNPVTFQFAGNPSQFAQQNMLNAYNSESNFKPGHPDNRLHLPTPAHPTQNPMINANDAKVSVLVHKQGNGNANMTFAPITGNPGATAYYVPYVQQGQGGLGGIQGVPMHPRPGDTNMAVTGPLNGCAVHAFHNTQNNTMSFMHHANYDQPSSAGKLAQFKQDNPHLRPVGSITPSDYAHPVQSGPNAGIPAGATVFAHYDQPALNQQGQWKLTAQLNTFQNGAGPAGRPELTRPDVGGQSQLIERPLQ